VRLAAAVAEAVGPPLSRTLAFEETARAISRLEEADRQEKQVLALIAHDMRTPITVIAGFARSLREKWDDLQEGERLASLDAILRNGANLSRLVEQDMQFALVESGELPYEMSAFDVGAQVERIVDDFSGTADARFALEIARPLPLVRGDQQRNSQILGNLLSNAVKFSPPGTLIEIGCCERDAMVHVSVRDHGPGISHGDTKKLFRKFERVTNGHAVPVDGTGLGLYLSRCMVEAQGGRIWVDSRRGSGSTFTYTLPQAAAQWGPGTIPR